MHWMNKLERKLGKYAIKNLILYILGAYAVGYIIMLFSPEAYYFISMDPKAICHGQVWRLVTWVCTPPGGLSVFTIFMFLFYYWIGQTLESVWGAFRYNIYMFMGILFMTLGPVLIYLATGLLWGFDQAWNLSTSTEYLNWTSFMAFATIFPNHEVYFMFVLRVKMKWLAIAEGVVLGYLFLQNLIFAIRYPDLTSGCLSVDVTILLSVANFLIYFLTTRNYKQISPKEVKRKRKYRKQVKEATARGTRHYCAVCGRTEATNPELQFRFCSKCKGNLEYCSDHLFTHEHKK